VNTLHNVVGGTTPIVPEVEDALVKELEIILGALTIGAHDLVSVVGNVLAVALALRSLTQAQLNALVTTLTQLDHILNPLAIVLKSGTNNLTPEIILRISDIADAVPSFLTPLVTFLFNLSSFANSSGLTVVGFVTVVQGLATTIQALITNFGLPSLTGVLTALNSVLSLLAKPI
jgi:phage-related minor tail protein